MADRDERSSADRPGAEATGGQPTAESTDTTERTERAGGADGRTAPGPRRTPFTQQVGRVIILVAAVLFGIFAVANVDSVTFNWIFGEGRVPLILLLLVAFGFGALIAWLATIRSRR